MKAWFAFEDAIGRITRILAGVCLAVVFVLFLLNILTRVPFVTWNPTWIDETIQFFLVWMIFLAAAELARIGGHFAVDVLAEKARGTGAGRWMRLVAAAVMLLTYALIFFFGVKLCIRSSVKATFTLPYFVKMSWFYSCIPICSFLMCAYGARDLVLAVADIATSGAVSERLEKRRKELAGDDEDSRIIEEAAKALGKDEKKDGTKD
jgi:TRAP-type C4-dicarboxylate transport system permease small subunit